MVDYYRILEISNTATENEIKKAYKRLALKWHPDKNPDNLEEANKRFRELSEAYEVLSDEKKRRIYDQYGKVGNDRDNYHSSGFHMHDEDFDLFGFPFAFRSPEEVFREFFGASPFVNLFSDSTMYTSSSNRRSQNNGGTSSSSRGHHGVNAKYNTQQTMMETINVPLNGFFSLSTFDSLANNFGRSDGIASKGAVKRTSTSTTFVNGKKLMTKRVYENGKETVFSYENDVLKSKTVNGVAQKLSSIKN